MGRAVIASLLLLGGCQPCNERCAGLWEVIFEGAGPLQDGRYDVRIERDAGDVLEASCTISDEASEAECDLQLGGQRTNPGGPIDELRLVGPEVSSTFVEVRLSFEGEVVVDAADELDYDGPHGCNPHCKVATLVYSIAE